MIEQLGQSLAPEEHEADDSACQDVKDAVSSDLRRKNKKTDERADTSRDKEAGEDGVADVWEAGGYKLGHTFVLSLASGCRMVHKFDSNGM